MKLICLSTVCGLPLASYPAPDVTVRNFAGPLMVATSLPCPSVMTTRPSSSTVTFLTRPDWIASSAMAFCCLIVSRSDCLKKSRLSFSSASNLSYVAFTSGALSRNTCAGKPALRAAMRTFAMYASGVSGAKTLGAPPASAPPWLVVTPTSGARMTPPTSSSVASRRGMPIVLATFGPRLNTPGKSTGGTGLRSPA